MTGMAKSEIHHGFGVPNDIEPHRFVVKIPQHRGEAVSIDENFGAAGLASNLRSICRVRIPRPTWRAVADEVKVYLNRRLREKGIRAGRFETGEVLVERLLGRELTVLGWAIEEMSPEEAAACVPKWASYRPEELWWLFNQIDRDAGEYDDARTGWRRGIRHVFAPATAPAIEKRAKRRSVDRSHTPDLFSGLDPQG
jgi:hypothetical protein